MEKKSLSRWMISLLNIFLIVVYYTTSIDILSAKIQYYYELCKFFLVFVVNQGQNSV